MTKADKSLDTWLAQAGHFIEEATGSVIPAITPSATFARDENYELRGGYMYARYGTPGSTQIEEIIKKTEGAQSALVFNSGLSAASAVLECLPQGARVIAPKVMYFGVTVLMERLAAKKLITLASYEPGDLSDLRSKSGARADLIWVETPANPDWRITDIKEAADIARASGGRLLVDGTCAPPVTTRALELGADYAFHSATKYLNGHSDVTAGVVSTKTIDATWEAIRETRKLQGTILPAFDAWLLIRGLRTLGIRWDKASENAYILAKHFERHPKIEKVLYPGLESHPGHFVAKKQMSRGFGGMLSLLLRGDSDATKNFVKRTKIFLPATSLGGVESLIEHRLTIEGPDYGVPPNLVRLSVGIEDVEDLIEDLEGALI